MKKLIYLLVIAITLLSCKKEYKYEVYAETGLFSSIADEKISDDVIKEINDSLAFMKAHRHFLISMQIKFDNNNDFHPEIYYFKLYNPKGIDISSGSFLINPEKAMKFNADLLLSDKFKEYIKNLPKQN